MPNTKCLMYIVLLLYAGRFQITRRIMSTTRWIIYTKMSMSSYFRGVRL